MKAGSRFEFSNAVSSKVKIAVFLIRFKLFVWAVFTGRKEGESAELLLSEDCALENMTAMHLHCKGGPGTNLIQ
jgi:hypothetical protein